MQRLLNLGCRVRRETMRSLEEIQLQAGLFVSLKAWTQKNCSIVNTQMVSGSGSAIGIGSFQSRPVPRPFFFFLGLPDLGILVPRSRLL
jgi:hypothetical protein